MHIRINLTTNYNHEHECCHQYVIQIEIQASGDVPGAHRRTRPVQGSAESRRAGRSGSSYYGVLRTGSRNFGGKCEQMANKKSLCRAGAVLLF